MAKVGILVGSLRKESFSQSLAENILALFPNTFEVEILSIGQLPLYNQDFDDIEGNEPESYKAFRAKVKEKDIFIFVTPEYNRSLPAVLKNALDIGSRPKSDNVWSNKVAGIISNSPGMLGGFGANHHLRQVLTPLNVKVLQQPEVYLSQVAQLFDDDRKIKNEGTVNFLQSFINEVIALR
ncbi:MAG TPA: NAD(P)H-dependent oxidoreductase [Bacillota bacterium]|nr:NAD(P)H-dependent oxidoreductase [Bacillota bacterium]